MYRRPKFLEILDEIRQEMSREADYDMDLFAEIVRVGEGKEQKVTDKTEDVVIFRPLVFEDLSKTKD